jgi:hypothetical protein
VGSQWWLLQFLVPLTIREENGLLRPVTPHLTGCCPEPNKRTEADFFGTSAKLTQSYRNLAEMDLSETILVCLH